MKTLAFKNILAAVTLGSAAIASLTAVNAQETTVTTTAAPATAATSTTQTTETNTAGTITSFTPGSSQIVVRSSTGAPATYTYSKKTTFVDASGNVVNYETIKAGEPTTVYYTTENGQPVVSKVVVQRTVAAPVAPVTKTETTETTTTTTSKK